MNRKQALAVASMVTAAGMVPIRSLAAATLTPAEARQIGKEAYIYGFPMIDSYRIQYTFFVDAKNPQFKAPWNHILNVPRVFTPADTTIQTPNSDTPYSYIGQYLRAEPIVISVSPIEKSRYWSIQLIDAFTYNFDYIGSRTTGNGGGHFLIAGPHWKGAVPKNITKVFRSESDISFAQFRTQLFDAADLPNVKEIQARYKVQTLSSFLGGPPPPNIKPVSWIKPLAADEQRSSLQGFDIVNFLLTFCATNPSEVELMKRFASINVGAGMNFDANSVEIKKAIQDGIGDAWAAFEEKKTELATGKLTSGDLFGTRAYLKNNYLYRMTAAVLGIYGNSKEEAIYPTYYVDAENKPLDAAQNAYTIHFAAEQLPPVYAFWSLTMYDSPASLLVANAIDRYLLNSPMLPTFKRDADGGLTFYLQNTSPGADKESNWLPAPAGPFRAYLRLYLPKEAALDGRWQPPKMVRVSG